MSKIDLTDKTVEPALTQQILNTTLTFISKKKRFPEYQDLEQESHTYAQVRDKFKDLDGLIEYVKEKFPNEYAVGKAGQDLYVAKMFGQWCKSNKKIPEEMTPKIRKDIGLTKQQIDTVGGYGDLRRFAKEKFPELFEDVFDTSLLDEKSIRAGHQELKSYKTFFVTAVVTGGIVDKECYAAVETFCKFRKAKKIFAISGKKIEEIDPIVQDDFLVVRKNVDLNKNLLISSIKILPTQIDPLTSIQYIVDKEMRSVIVASPRQRLEIKPRSRDVKVPMAYMSTGAITNPVEQPDELLTNRMQDLARYNNKKGGLVVEVTDNQHFHFRQVQFDQDGSFADLGYRFYPDGRVKKDSPLYIVLGDIHSGEIDWASLNASLWASKILGIKTAVLHDLFSGISVNRHEWDKNTTLAIKHMMGELDLEKELLGVVRSLQYMAKSYVRMIVPVANHHLFVDLWIEVGGYLKDRINHKIGLELAQYLAEGKNPVQEYVMKVFNRERKKTETETEKTEVIWLEDGESYKIAGVELGFHGHRGNEGSKGSNLSNSKNMGKAITAHFHYPCIKNELFGAGTKSILNPPYTKGNPTSRWMHSDVIGYGDGSRQILNDIDGWFTNFEKKPKS